MKIEGKVFALSVFLNLSIVSMYFFDIETNFGTILLWLMPIYLLALFCDNIVNSILVFLHGLVLSGKYSHFIIDKEHAVFYSLVFAAVVFVAYKTYSLLYKGDEVSRHASVFIAATIGSLIVFYVGLISSNFDYIMNNIAAAIYSAVGAAVISYVYRSVIDDIKKRGV